MKSARKFSNEPAILCNGNGYIREHAHIFSKNRWPRFFVYIFKTLCAFTKQLKRIGEAFGKEESSIVSQLILLKVLLKIHLTSKYSKEFCCIYQIERILFGFVVFIDLSRDRLSLVLTELYNCDITYMYY